jgi:putative nucleotidyltransferase with HDIG domain
MKYTRIALSQTTPGMVTAENVTTPDGHLVVMKGTALTDKTILHLKACSIDDFLVYTNSEFVSCENSFVINTFHEKVRNSESFQRFCLAYKNNIQVFQNTLCSTVNEQSDIDLNLLLNEVHKILFRFDTHIELFKMLHQIRHFDDTTYVHSLNVALICNIIGKWLHFDTRDMEVITLCGLLHDVGKLLIPLKIISKPSRLSTEEFSTIQSHTIYGYNILKNNYLDKRIALSALMHHERCDGSGYPYGFSSGKIDPFAKLVAIADVFEAMTSARVYRGPLCPFEVISMFEKEGFTKYDPKFVLIFLEGIVNTYMHNEVFLSNGVRGEIISINRKELSRPIIQFDDTYIDLTKNRELHIAAVI